MSSHTKMLYHLIGLSILGIYSSPNFDLRRESISALITNIIVKSLISPIHFNTNIWSKKNSYCKNKDMLQLSCDRLTNGQTYIYRSITQPVGEKKFQKLQ